MTNIVDPKPPYEPPALRALGTVAELTQDNTCFKLGPNADGNGVSGGKPLVCRSP